MTFSENDPRKQINVRVDDDLARALDDATDNKSQFIRDTLRERLMGPRAKATERQPPADAELREVWFTLLDMASPGGWVSDRRATNRLAQTMSLPEEETRRLIQQLRSMGYVRQTCDETGRNLAYQIRP